MANDTVGASVTRVSEVLVLTVLYYNTGSFRIHRLSGQEKIAPFIFITSSFCSFQIYDYFDEKGKRLASTFLDVVV